MTTMRRRTQADHHLLMPDVFKKTVDKAVIRADLLGYLPSWWPLQTRTSFARGCFEDEVLAGYVLYRQGDRDNSGMFTTRKIVLINDIAVDPARRGRGIARALIRDVAARTGGNDGEAELNATIWEGNAASHRAFAAEGFLPRNRTVSLPSKTREPDGT